MQRPLLWFLCTLLVALSAATGFVSAQYDHDYCGGWGLLPDCDCEEKMDAWNNCDSCNFAEGYYGVAPDCKPCWRRPGLPGDYCETANTNTRGATPTENGCECVCRNKFEGSRCETCPPNVQLLDPLGKNCETCVAGYGEYKRPDEVVICSPLCTTANCSGHGTASGTYASGCNCTCYPNYNISTVCSECNTGYNFTTNCQTCTDKFVPISATDRRCVQNCDKDVDCVGANTVSVIGNYFINCTCMCKDFWLGARCDKCPPLMNAACSDCVAGYRNAPNCVKICTPSDCSSHSSQVDGDYKVQCSCRCRNSWKGNATRPSLGAGWYNDCNICPPNFDVSTDCMNCTAGYQRVGPDCLESCTNPADCTNHAVEVTGVKGSCTCSCFGKWERSKCEYCPPRFDPVTCDECNVDYINFPDCIRNCTIEKHCNNHAHTVKGFSDGSCLCSCRNGWTGPACEFCPYQFDRDNDCSGCNATTHEGTNLTCYRKCTVDRNCTNHASSVTGNDNTTCYCNCDNKWTGDKCEVCPARYDVSKQCNACSALYEKLPNCYLKCTIPQNCSGSTHAINVSGNVFDGCDCTCDPNKKWYGGRCELCPINYDQTTCDKCAVGYTTYPFCYLKCTNTNCSNHAASVSGDTSTGCNCTCKDKWQGAICDICPTPGGNLSDNCRTCNYGYGGPLCLRNCTSGIDCNSHAAKVWGFEGNCTCQCANNWFGTQCDKCPVNYNSTNNCTGCAAGYVDPPYCYLNCTIEANCTGHATAVSGNSKIGCTCTCSNHWTDKNCSVCPVNFNPTKDCNACADTYNFFPQCVRDCTIHQDCSSHASKVIGAFPNCTCTCDTQWTGRDCGTCPPAYDPAQNCASCAQGYRGTYPDCHFICTAATNCSSHADQVEGDTSTGCTCTCAYQWEGLNCSVCPTRFNALTNCSTCAANYDNYPTCNYVCNDALDCSNHSTSVSGINWACTCVCRSQWTGSDCSKCPANYNASKDCADCARGFDTYPSCFLTCTIPNNCSNNAVLVSGNAGTGCNCTCRHGWFGKSCDQCPPLYDSSKDCNDCIPGWSGFPNCQELCTNSSDCSGRATHVSGYKGNCTCTCRNSYEGSRCDVCPERYDFVGDCGACAVGFDSYPLCALSCTVERDCSDQATSVSGNNVTGCNCTCRNQWESANCSYCAPNREARADCGMCAEGYDAYPMCARICTVWEDCSGHADPVSGVKGLFPNCSCTCSEQWTESDCSVCPQQYDPLNNCASCAIGFTGEYPVCSYVCTIASNCSGHAVGVSGTTLSGCNCTCRSKWFGGDCSKCEARYDPVKDCGACNYGYESYPECRTACMVDRDCNQRASNVTGIFPNCTCACRNQWLGAACDFCPEKYNATADCSACTTNREQYPACYRLCNFTDCSDNAVEVRGNENTGCKCACRNAYTGADCSVCPPTVNALIDCSTCKVGYGGYPLCGPLCTPNDCTNRSVTVSGGRPYCNCTCRNGWSGADCSVCPPQYNVSTDCFACNPDHTKVNGKCYRYCNVSLDCHDRGLSVTGNLGIGCQCKCRNNYTAPVCAECPTGYNLENDCTGCAAGWGGFPNCKPLCTNETHCSGHAVAVYGVIGECSCKCRNGWWGRECEICPAQYNFADDCGTCNKYRKQDYPNCSRLSRSMPTPTFSLLVFTMTEVVPSNTSTLTLALPNTYTASTLTQCLSTSDSLNSTFTTSTSWSTTASYSSTYSAATFSLELSESVSLPKSRTRPIPPTRTTAITATRSLPDCKLTEHCLHANYTYRDGYDCKCVCNGNWTGARCEQCPERYTTYRDVKGVIQGCSDCARDFFPRNGTCMTSSHFYGSLDAGNASCAGNTVTSRSVSEGVGSRLVFLQKLSYDLHHLLLGAYAYNHCPNVRQLSLPHVFSATVFTMYPTSSANPARDVRYLFDAVFWNETKSVAVAMSECMAKSMAWLLDVWKNDNVIPTLPPTTIPTTPKSTTPATTRTPRPTFAPGARAFAAADHTSDSNDTRPSNESVVPFTSVATADSSHNATETLLTDSSLDAEVSPSGTQPITQPMTHPEDVNTSTTSGTSGDNGTLVSTMTDPMPEDTTMPVTTTLAETTALITLPTTLQTTNAQSSSYVAPSTAPPASTMPPVPSTTSVPLYPLLMFNGETMFSTRNGSDYIYSHLGINGTGCLAFSGADFSYGDYARCGVIGCAPEDFNPVPPEEEDPFPWWWIVLALIALGVIIALLLWFRRMRLNRRVEEVVNPKDTHKYTLQFMLSEDEELRKIAEDRESEEMDYFDDDLL